MYLFNKIKLIPIFICVQKQIIQSKAFLIIFNQIDIEAQIVR